MSWLDNLTIRKKLNILVSFSLLIILALGALGLYEQKRTSLLERKSKLKAQVETTVSLVKYYNRHSQSLGEAVAKEMAIKAIQALRYDDKNYFWITNPQVKIVMHPTSPELNGTDASNIQDSSGKLFWQEMAKIAKEQNRGYLDYTWTTNEGVEQEKISYVAYIPEWQWIVGSGLLVSDLNDVFISSLIREGIIIGIVSILLLVTSFFIGQNIVQPIEILQAKVKLIAKGDLTTRLHSKRKDEVGAISHDMDEMLDKIHSAITLANHSATQSTHLVDDLASSSNKNSASVQSQYMQLELLATAMDEMNSTNVEVTRNAEFAATTTSAVATAAESSSNDMSLTVRRISDADQAMASVTELVEHLKHSVLNIADVTLSIQKISEQTNLLALNAAIEAARAGEHGRGFSVVADEVRALAANTNQATNQIQSSIEELTDSASKASEAVFASRKQVQGCVAVSQDTGTSLQAMVAKLKSANDMVTQIASSAEEQSAVSNEISENVTAIKTSANEINIVTTHLVSQSQELVQNSAALSNNIAFFKL
ncbi:methyl-accepting chemotaxis protein [Shewanella sp. A14]